MKFFTVAQSKSVATSLALILTPHLYAADSKHPKSK